MGVRAAFDALELDLNAARTTLDAALQRIIGLPEAYDPRTHSVHWLLAAGIACSDKVSVKRILEYGTHTAAFTVLLRELFPAAEIVTLDLAEDDPLYLSTYQGVQDPKLQRHLSERRQNLARADVTFIQTNSFFAPRILKGDFDLVWVDAGHMFPEVAWDICAAYNLTRPGGYLLTDDVLPDAQVNATGLVSHATWQMAHFLKEHTPSTTYLVPKRTDAGRYLNPQKRKFVSVSVVQHPTVKIG